MSTEDAAASWLDTIEIVGGHPALDFVDTIHSYTPSSQRDYLQSTDHLIDWCRHMELISEEQTNGLAGMTTSGANTLLSDARSLRTTLNAVFRGHLKGQPNNRALAELNEWLKDLACYRSLQSGPNGYAWCHEITRAYPRSLLAPVVFAAAELLQSKTLAQLKSCPPPEGCGWLFLDRSRNGSRTWCNMKTCGNAAKQRRHRARRHAAIDT